MRSAWDTAGGSDVTHVVKKGRQEPEKHSRNQHLLLPKAYDLAQIPTRRAYLQIVIGPVTPIMTRSAAVAAPIVVPSERWHSTGAGAEDRATLGSEPSAAMGGYTDGARVIHAAFLLFWLSMPSVIPRASGGQRARGHPAGVRAGAPYGDIPPRHLQIALPVRGDAVRAKESRRLAAFQRFRSAFGVMPPPTASTCR